MKVVQLRIGTRSKTDVALMYIEISAKDEVVKEIKKQLDEPNIDGIFDSGMLEQLMEQDSKSPFPQYQLTRDRTKRQADSWREELCSWWIILRRSLCCR